MNLDNKMKKMETVNYFKKCNLCGKEMLIQIVLFGVNHNAEVWIGCKECLKRKGLDEKFKEASPESAKEIEEWLNEKKI